MVKESQVCEILTNLYYDFLDGLEREAGCIETNATLSFAVRIFREEFKKACMTVKDSNRR
ncbi:hypothetical protein [Syntrophus aciditrophicus]|uniref:hypothetical protein n=1 Tax=Syntrophus aciditrophicus TaxID=316277 RepID=UPI00059FBDDD|nr:hypothetical protein [Syntrophus aciditrophicus]